MKPGFFDHIELDWGDNNIGFVVNKQGGLEKRQGSKHLRYTTSPNGDNWTYELWKRENQAMDTKRIMGDFKDNGQ